MSTKLNQTHKIKPLSVIGGLMILSIFLAACSSAAPSTQAVATPGSFQGSVAATPTTMPVAPAATADFDEVEVKVATDPVLGQILVDDKGMTLYMFTKDEPDKSNCDAACLEKWPPLVTQGTPKADSGVDASMLGTTTTTDGRTIVTYNHMPLYYWYKDTKPGDTLGQDVGGVWYVVSPTGDIIKSAPEASSTAAPTTAPTSSSDDSTSAGEATINVASNATLGEFLVDGKGMTLYIFTRDTADTSNCDAACLDAWPPFLTQGNPVLGAGVDDSKVGTTTTTDGRTMVTYNHMPLYYWYEDLKPGDTLGQGVGSVWYVIDPDGDIIR